MHDDVLVAREELREVARAMLAERASSGRVRALFDDPLHFDRDLWSAMAELGWLAIEIPEELGGMGASVEFLAVILEELGRAAAGGPFMSTAVLATGALLSYGTDEQRSSWLPRFAAGDAVGTVAFGNTFGQVAEGRGVLAEQDGSGWRLTGRPVFVPDACAADVIVVAAQHGQSSLLFLVEADTPGVSVDVLPTLDLTRGFGTVDLNVTVDHGSLLVATLEEPTQLAALANRAGVALACDSLGNAQRSLDMTTTYANERVQFGRPIGAFQAVKHQCADMLVGVESSRAITDAAVEAIAADPTRASQLAAMAKSYACASAAEAAGRGIQLHGGIGYTWEHDMHVMFKRAKLNEALFGDRRWHRMTIAESVLASDA